MKRYISIIACLATFFATACDTDGTDPLFTDQDTGSGDTSDASFDVGPAEGTGTLDGTWLTVATVEACVIAVGGILKGRAAIQIVEIKEFSQTGRTASHTRREICDYQTTEFLGVVGQFPASTYEAINYYNSGDVILSDAEVGEGTYYESPLECQVWGMTMDDPFGDPFPEFDDDGNYTTAEGVSVVDSDNNGKPGVNMALQPLNCQLEMIQRSFFRYEGEFVDKNNMHGVADFDAINVSISAVGEDGEPNSFCEQSNAVEPYPETGESWMMRVDGEGGSLDLTDDDGVVRCGRVLEFVNSDARFRPLAPTSSNCN